MNSKPKLGPDDPLIKAVFAGIYRSSEKIFFKINLDGRHQQIPVFKALDNFDITHDNKTEIIHTFPFPILAYSSERMRLKAALVAEKANKKPKRSQTQYPDGDESDITDEDLERDIASGSGKRNPEYFLVTQNNGFFGCFNAREGAVVAFFKTKNEAEAYIENLLHGGWSFKPFYGN